VFAVQGVDDNGQATLVKPKVSVMTEAFILARAPEGKFEIRIDGIRARNGVYYESGRLGRRGDQKFIRASDGWFKCDS
jgi:hypothetical protein